MLGDTDIPMMTETQDSIQETVSGDVIPNIEALVKARVVEDTFDCRWDTCDQKFLNLRDLCLHVNNSHIAALPWNARYLLINLITRSNRDVFLVCKWADCWNPHPFAYQMRMVDHVRAHTLEKPYVIYW